MPIEITMPALSPTMEEGNLAKWLVKEGDKITSGDVIAEIETDKATMEVEAVDEGTIAKIYVEEGAQGVKVNSVIAVLLEEGEDASAVSNTAPVAAAPRPAAVEEPTPEPVKETEMPASPQVASKPAPVTTPTASNDGNRIFASPLARRIAEQKGIDLSTISGSGPHGRIIKADVENASPSQASASATSQPASQVVAPSISGMSDDTVLKLYEEGAYELLPHDGMRRIIAERLTESTQTIPAYTLSMECNLDALLKLRSQINSAAPLNDDGKPAFKISVNDFIVKAMALALRDVPMANGSWTSDARILHKHSDVGVAVAVDDGLFTPIVRKAEMKTLSEISGEIKDMAKRARDKKLSPQEYQGGSTAVSNLGMFGVSSFTSIINPPHASIVSIGVGEKKAIVKDGAIAMATMMDATFAFDHRVIDGALGAQLAGAFKNYIENPMGMLV